MTRKSNKRGIFKDWFRPQSGVGNPVTEDQVSRTVVYVLLLVALAVAVMLWMYHGLAIALGFVFLEIQFLLVQSTTGLISTSLSRMNELLHIMVSGRPNGAAEESEGPLQGYRQRRGGDRKIPNGMENSINH